MCRDEPTHPPMGVRGNYSHKPPSSCEPFLQLHEVCSKQSNTSPMSILSEKLPYFFPPSTSFQLSVSRLGKFFIVIAVIVKILYNLDIRSCSIDLLIILIIDLLDLRIAQN